MLTESEVKALLLDPMTDWFYLGRVNDGFIESFIGLLDVKPVFQRLSRNGRRKLLSAVVESLQNIRNNTPENLTEHPEAVVFMQRSAEHIWQLRCGNVMYSTEVLELRQRLELIVAADQLELRKMYMKQMNRTLNEHNNKSAGLGLIEMARSSSAPLRYRFVPLKSPYTFFAVELELTIN